MSSQLNQLNLRVRIRKIIISATKMNVVRKKHIHPDAMEYYFEPIHY